jgi:sec-independent protein translocase protein TatC
MADSEHAPKDHAIDPEMPFLSHLIELRDRLLRSVLAVLVLFLCLFPFANPLFEFLADPLLRHLPEGGTMLATEVASPFLTPLKLTLVLAIFASIPYLLYHLWAFIAPGLYRHEKNLLVPLMFSSIALFYLGMIFAYYIVFPLVFGFFASVVPEGVEMATDIARYLDFVLKMFFAFGIAFEVPVLTVLIISTGMTSADALASKRPYIIVGTFVIAMLLTPPDMFSQILLAVPMWLLFELGLFMARFIQRQKAEREAEEAAAEAERAGFRSLSEHEMDAKLDEMEAQDKALTQTWKKPDTQ